MIKAPFNFIPLSDQVVFPDWAGQISHDVPFSDGISGEISVSLTAESPIFVSDGHSQNEKRGTKENPATFSKIGDKYFLPGTTVKGAIRNVLEILSFSKMSVDPNARFAQRDLNNKDAYPIIKEQKEIHCGWLREKEEGYEIIDCGRPYRIGQINIDEYIGSNLFENEFSEKNRVKLTDAQKNACYKYNLLAQRGLLNTLTDLRFAIQDSDKRTVKVKSDGSVYGTIVLTGQPNKWKLPRKDNKGKYYEFVFPETEGYGKAYYLSDEIVNQYKFVYAESEDWKYACTEFLNKKGIPVFFRVNEATNEIKDWGLAFLYKLPYNRSVADSLPEDHGSKAHDLAECIFGYIIDKVSETKESTQDKERKYLSLKGRVQFSPFISDNAKTGTAAVELVLAGPKASYYPIYVDQEIQGNRGVLDSHKSYLAYNKMDKKGGKPNGWKRYLLRSNTWGKTATETTDTYILPILPGAEFKGTIRFHNLRPVELGALLTALSFHGNQDTYHQIGMAKPYGYGKVKLKINSEKKETEFYSVGKPGNDILSIEGYMAKFEEYMNVKLEKTWTLTPQVKELLTLASFDVPSSGNFDYMVLDMDNKNNEFIEAKKDRLYLQKYSSLLGQSFNVSSALSAWKEAQLAEQKLKDTETMEAVAQRAQEAAAEVAAARKMEQIQKGLAILNETHEGKYKVDEFKKLRNAVIHLNMQIVPDDQLSHLEEALLRLSRKPSRDEKKKKLWSNRESSIWTFIEKITSMDFADKLYNKINNK